MKHNILLNMETADPDDCLCLCLLTHHPKVNLVGITLYPGSDQQVAIVKDILCLLGKEDIPVGVCKPNYPKSCVSEFHNKWLGERRYRTEWQHDGLGEDLIYALHKQYPDLKIISGAALTCVSKYIEKYNGALKEIVVQGGFAGDNVVPEEYRLPKFKGKITCPSFNLNADIPAAKTIIATENIRLKRFVSKNVCHRIIYDQEMHERIKPHRNNNPGLNLMVDGMEHYLKNKPTGKAFHDPLAACVAINPKICKYAEVEIYRENGEWGSRLTERNGPVSDTFITIGVDRERFEKVLIGIE